MSEQGKIARAFHETYERLAPKFGYKTREDSAKPWHEVPPQNRELMKAVVLVLLDGGVIASEAEMVNLQADLTQARARLTRTVELGKELAKAIDDFVEETDPPGLWPRIKGPLSAWTQHIEREGEDG